MNVFGLILAADSRQQSFEGVDCPWSAHSVHQFTDEIPSLATRVVMNWKEGITLLEVIRGVVRQPDERAAAPAPEFISVRGL